ncbi:MAG TPA: secretin N-terminal domain-containing protein [Blastocatellia bacterium]|nr:secretin N-terminal domain-containing protein [Blastocatellia bacterium]
MAKRMPRVQQSIALALALFLCAPAAGFAADGKKHFREGLRYEENRQWDKAAEQFALAVAEKPSNTEYQLHLQRALVSAGLMLVERGDGLADKKDYNAAYTAYRQAFSFDPSNELALIKMRRMLEKQGLPTTDLPKNGDPSGPKIRPEGNDPNQKVFFSNSGGGYPASPVRIQLPSIPGRRFARTDVIYRDTNLLTAIEQLAQMMKLNVVPDQSVSAQLKQMRTTIELRDVTYPRALEVLLKTNNMMYAQLDSRTIVIASDNPQSRQKYEPLAVRTFYIKNADIDQLKSALGLALPQTKNVSSIKQLNALIVRDTPANLEMVDQLISSLDKSKAEVLIDVNIYEVTRTDLVQLGNQFNTPAGQSGAADLTTLGGFGQTGNPLGYAHIFTQAGLAGFMLGMPPSIVSAFQSKGKGKLLASTQIHVLDNEQNAVRIGQRVPIQTASIPSYYAPNTTPGTPTPGQNPGVNNVFATGIPQIQYENVGLNIDVQPNVFEDDVQMKMKIETTSIDGSTGTLTPTFNQRTMTSIARVKDGQTTLIAGVSQDIETKSVKGLPLIGLIPILGRFFATPSIDNKQSDVVITVTPHILRRADIREEDHLARWAGDAQNSSNQLKIEQILYLADLQDSQDNPVAAAAPEPAKPVTDPKPAPPTSIVTTRSESPGVVVQPVLPAPSTSLPPAAAKSNIVKTKVDKPGAENVQSNKKVGTLDDDDDDDEDDDDSSANQNTSPLMVYVRPTTAVATKGQDLFVALFVNGNGEISSTHLSLSFDPSLLEVKGVRDSGLLSAGARAELQFTAEGGLINIQIDRPQGVPAVPARGQLCLIVFAVKAPGQSPLVLNEQATTFRTPTGQTLPIRVQSSHVEIR